jgi:MFS family permease
LMFSSYYFYDIISSIKDTLQTQTGMTNEDYGTMYGAYSFTNAFLLMALFGGMILDRWGIRKTGSIFISFIVIGTFLTAYGSTSTFQNGGFGHELFSSFLSSYSPELKMMLLGRLLFGLGAETFYVVINKVIAKWFKGKELALAFALSLALGRFGTAAALIYSPMLIPDLSIGPVDPAVWFGFMLIIVALLAFFVYLVYDIKFDKRQAEDGVEAEGEFKLSELFTLIKNKSFIYITLLCILFYAAVFPFIGFAPDFLHNKFGVSLLTSGRLTSILPFGTIIFTPIFGWWCDNKGKSASLMIIGSLLLIIVHLTFSLTMLTPYIPLFLLGVAFSLVPAAMWPSVAKIVPDHQLGTAYGFMFTIQNFGMMGVPILMGKTLDLNNKGVAEGAPLDYTYTILMLSVLGIFGIVFALLLKREDKTSGYGLELSNKIKD